MKTPSARGYRQVELNNCAFRRDGRIVADCIAAIDIENGCCVLLDRVKKEAKLGGTSGAGQLALCYSAEHNPEDVTGLLKNFVNKEGRGIRAGFLAYGDVFTTNAIQMVDADYADLSKVAEALKAGTPVHVVGGTVGSLGLWTLQKTAPTATDKITGFVKEVTTMPDGQPAVKIVIEKAL